MNVIVFYRDKGSKSVKSFLVPMRPFSAKSGNVVMVGDARRITRRKIFVDLVLKLFIHVR